jgi:endoglucanase
MIKTRSTILFLLLLAGAVFAAVSSGSEPDRRGSAAAPDPRGVSPSSPNPLKGLEFYVDPQSPSMLSYRHLKRQGQTRKAKLIWKIAREPKNLWLGRFTRPNFAIKINRLIDAAKAEGTVPLFSVLRAESTKCSPKYQAGGPSADRRIKAWYDALARVIGNERVVIAFEPDSLGTIRCHARSRQDDRYRVLRHGVTVLSRLPRATIYLEAGASDWEPARRTAAQLRRIGIKKVRGFMLNATHYDWVSNNIRHGLAISRRVGGKHFIINTAESGRGPVHYMKGGRRINIWCNPGLRGMGPPPTTKTAHRKVDAYLWVNRPGYAQSCQGRPIEWYLPRALTLARFATNWERPPKGARFGHLKRYPLRAFGIPR